MMNIDVLVVIDQFESIVQHESYQVTFIFIYSCHNVLRKVNKKKVVSIHCVISERMKWVSKWKRFATEHAYRSFPISSFDLRFQVKSNSFKHHKVNMKNAVTTGKQCARLHRSNERTNEHFPLMTLVRSSSYLPIVDF